MMMLEETEDIPSFISLNNLLITIQTNNTQSTGSYRMKIRVKNSHSTTIYTDYSFTLRVLCNLNYTAPSITGFKYSIG